MSTTILPLFDKTLQTTAIWLDEIMTDIGPDRAFAWRVLSVVLQQLRDHLAVELSAHLGAQLPLIIRGAFYEGFEPTGLPKADGAQAFLDGVTEALKKSRNVNPQKAVTTVFGVLVRHISHGQVDKIVRSLPRDIRSMWPEAAIEPPKSS